LKEVESLGKRKGPCQNALEGVSAKNKKETWTIWLNSLLRRREVVNAGDYRGGEKRRKRDVKACN